MFLMSVMIVANKNNFVKTGISMKCMREDKRKYAPTATDELEDFRRCDNRVREV